MEYTNDLKEIADITNNINIANSKKNNVDKCRYLYSALESIFEAYFRYAKANNLLSEWASRYIKNKPHISKNLKLSETVNALLTKEQKLNLFEQIFFKELIWFRPLIMNDGILENNRYNPNNISEELKEKAQRTHLNLINAYNQQKRTEILIEKLCRVLYEVRSNLSHSGKTPYGPDKGKSLRDETVCSVISPILEYIINILIKEPNKKLLVYGTLRKGSSNAEIIDILRTEYQEVYVWGFIEVENNLPYYTFSISSPANKIKVELIVNNDLPKYYDKLDVFEGEKYIRSIVPYEINGKILTGYIYEKKQPNR